MKSIHREEYVSGTPVLFLFKIQVRFKNPKINPLWKGVGHEQQCLINLAHSIHAFKPVKKHIKLMCSFWVTIGIFRSQILNQLMRTKGMGSPNGGKEKVFFIKGGGAFFQIEKKLQGFRIHVQPLKREPDLKKKGVIEPALLKKCAVLLS